MTNDAYIVINLKLVAWFDEWLIELIICSRPFRYFLLLNRYLRQTLILLLNLYWFLPGWCLWNWCQRVCLESHRRNRWDRFHDRHKCLGLEVGQRLIRFQWLLQRWEHWRFHWQFLIRYWLLDVECIEIQWERLLFWLLFLGFDSIWREWDSRLYCDGLALSHFRVRCFGWF